MVKEQKKSKNFLLSIHLALAPNCTIKGLLKELSGCGAATFVKTVDNQACIALCKQSMHKNKTKHYALKIHYPPDLYNKEIQLGHLSTDNMSANS